MPPPSGGGGTGAASAPGPLQGSATQGMTALKVALEALQKALPQLPMGSEIHTAVVKSIGELGKHFADGGQGQGDPGANIQTLMEMMRNAKQSPNMAAMMPPGGGGAPPGGPPGGDAGGGMPPGGPSGSIGAGAMMGA